MAILISCPPVPSNGPPIVVGPWVETNPQRYPIVPMPLSLFITYPLPYLVFQIVGKVRYLQCSYTIKFTICINSEQIKYNEKKSLILQTVSYVGTTSGNKYDFIPVSCKTTKKTTQNNRRHFRRWDRFELGNISLLMILVALKKAGCFQVLGWW